MLIFGFIKLLALIAGIGVGCLLAVIILNPIINASIKVLPIFEEVKLIWDTMIMKRD